MAFHKKGGLGIEDMVRAAGSIAISGTFAPASRRTSHASSGPTDWRAAPGEPGVFDCIAGDDTQFEREPLSRLAAAGELMAHRHERFWQCMETLKEAQDLNALCRRGAAPSCSSKRLQQEDKCHISVVPGC